MGGRRPGFTLLELLAVLAILSILAVLIVPAVRGIASASELSASAAGMVDTINLARQTALSANRPVEVRFYEVPRSRNAEDPSLAYRAVGIYQINDTGSSPIARLSLLRGNVVMSDSATFGTLLNCLPLAQSAVPAIDPSGATKFNYHYFLFRPDGSVDLPRTAPVSGGDSWHVMLYDVKKPPAGQTPPSNYIAIQLDTSTGRTRTFQPGQN